MSGFAGGVSTTAGRVLGKELLPRSQGAPDCTQPSPALTTGDGAKHRIKSGVTQG